MLITIYTLLERSPVFRRISACISLTWFPYKRIVPQENHHFKCSCPTISLMSIPVEQIGVGEGTE